MRKRITLADIAAHAGVSRATASLVLRNTGNLADSTRERVRASMDALGYVYHRGAASMRASRSQTIGLIVPDLTNAFTAELSMGIESVLAGSDVVTLISDAFEDVDRQDMLVQSMLERQVDGLVVIPAVGSGAAFAERLATTGLPCVVATREIPHPQLTYVGIDNALGGRLAARHLLEHGCRRFAYIGGFAKLPPRRDRVRGVRYALRKFSDEAALDINIAGTPRGDWGWKTATELLADGVLPDGVICHSDLVSFGIFRALRERAPDLLRQVRIVSYDDVGEAALWEPPLTSVAANGQEVGQRAAEALLRLIATPGSTPERILITPKLVVRASCGCPQGALTQQSD